jgi:hypothetical protein
MISDISTIANVITAITTLGMIGIAWSALRTWQKEFIGKKKIGFGVPNNGKRLQHSGFAGFCL